MSDSLIELLMIFDIIVIVWWRDSDVRIEIELFNN